MELSAEDLALLDPFPDIVALFLHYNSLYFGGTLHTTSVQWSSERMTRCAGTCSYGNGAPVIKLSAPLMKYRTTEDMKDTLLHEMIHAYLFTNGQHRRDGDHGPRFRAKMHEINSSSLPDHQRPAAGYKLDVYHTFHAEVREHQKHHWRCQRCGDFIQRAMNRPPQEADCRSRSGAGCTDSKCHYHVHKKGCGGTYIKVAEPEGFSEKQKKGKRKGEAPKFAADSGAPQAKGTPPSGGVTLDSFFKRIPKQEDLSSGSAAQQEGGGSASVLPNQANESNRQERGVKARGHAADSAQERRERLMHAAQQRIDRLKTEEPSSSFAGEGQSAAALIPQASNGRVTLEQDCANSCVLASAQHGSNGRAIPALKRDIAETLHAPKRRRRQPEQLDETVDGGDGNSVSTFVKSEASSDDDVIEVTAASTGEGPGVGKELNRISAGEQALADGECTAWGQHAGSCNEAAVHMARDQPAMQAGGIRSSTGPDG